jgi:glucan endo-1,3-alpha-glucosidase
MPKGWAYEGCVEESNGQRLLQGFAFSSGQTDQDNCASVCGAMGYQFAGTQYANEVRLPVVHRIDDIGILVADIRQS